MTNIGKQAPYLDGIKVVASSAERDALFPSPDTNQRVHNLTTGYIERWDGANWLQEISVGRGGIGAVFTLRAFGAKGDGTTDDTAAIASAITAAAAVVVASGQKGARITVPTGDYITNSQVVIPEGVVLTGEGRTGSCIKAGPSFPTSTAVVLLGASLETLTFGARLEDMAIDCSSIAGSIGVESTKINELSGLRRVEVFNYMSRGVYIHGSAAQNYVLNDLYLLASASASGTYYGLDLDGGGSALRGVDGVTVDHLGSGSHTAGVRVNNASSFLLSRIHVENCTDGVLIGDVTTCSAFALIGISGSTPITTVVRITAGQSFSLVGIQNIAGATNALVDTQRSTTRTDTALPLYTVGDGASFQPVLDLSDTIGAQSTFRTLFVKGNLFVGAPGANTGTSAINHGQATLVAGTKVVNVAPATLVTANTRIFLSVKTPGGTPGWLQVSARTPSTSFTILSSSGTDTSVVDYLMVEP